jgi:hypothetical protein
MFNQAQGKSRIVPLSPVRARNENSGLYRVCDLAWKRDRQAGRLCAVFVQAGDLRLSEAFSSQYQEESAVTCHC